MLVLQHGIVNYSGAAPTGNTEFIFEVTVSDNTNVTIPHLSGYEYDYEVNWGDETGWFPVSSYNDPNTSHEYINNGTYNVTIRGLCETFCVNWNGLNNYLTKIIQWGNTGFKQMNLIGCAGNTQIPDDLVGGFSKMTSFSQAFYYNYSTSLTSIPENLFKYATGATNFDYVFYYCPYLASIPENLFKYNTLATTFNYAFAYSYNPLLTSIPENLFKYNTLATNFYQTFTYLNYITTIPENLFKFNTQAQSFQSCFRYCGNLTTVPAGLFKYNMNAYNFSEVFANTGLYGAPEGLFTGATSASNFYRAFYQCYSFTSAAPPIWLQFPSASGVQCFSSCPASNYSSIPEDWGGPVVKLKMELYSETAPFTVTLPHLSGYTHDYYVEWGDGNSNYVTSWDDSGATHTYWSVGTIILKISGICETFFITSGNSLQSYVNKITSWGQTDMKRMCFSGCTILQTIPKDSDNALSLMEDFISAFAYCTAMFSAAPKFWISYSAKTGTDCFLGDSELYNYSYVPSDWGGLGGTAIPMIIKLQIPYDNFTAIVPTRQYNDDQTYEYEYDYNIDWGDGSPIQHVTDYYSGQHTYLTGNTSYIVQISGTCEAFDSWGGYGYYIQQTLLEVLQWGQLEFIRFRIPSCSYLHTISATDGKSLSLINDFTYMLYYCQALTGVTSTMFSGCTAGNFTYVFYQCTSLLSIPLELFDGCLNAYYFYGTFYGCSALTGYAPELWNRTAPYPTPSDGQCFAGCTGLTNYADASIAGWV